VPAARLTDSAFWCLLFRLRVPSPDSAVSTLYGALLPYLLDRSMASLPSPEEPSDWSVAPVAGDASRSCCVMEAVRVAAGFVSSGCNPSVGSDVQVRALKWGWMSGPLSFFPFAVLSLVVVL
jgi:hypothetical protein